MKLFAIVTFIFSFTEAIYATDITYPIKVIPKTLPSDIQTTIDLEKEDLDAEVLGKKATKKKKKKSENALKAALEIKPSANSNSKSSNNGESQGVILKDSTPVTKESTTGELKSKSGTTGLQTSRITSNKKESNTENSLTKGVFDEVPETPAQKKIPSSPGAQSANSNTAQSTTSNSTQNTLSPKATTRNPIPPTRAPTNTPAALAVLTPSPTVANVTPLTPIVLPFNKSQDPSPAARPNEKVQTQEKGSTPSDNSTNATVESQKCLKECTDYVAKLPGERSIAAVSIANGGSKVILRNADAGWARPGQGGTPLKSNFEGNIFYEACKGGVDSEVDPRSNFLYNINFKNTESLEPSLKAAIEECKTKFAAIAKEDKFATQDYIDFSEENELEFEELERARRKGNRKPATLSAAKPKCLEACNDVINAYKNGNVMVERIASSGDDFHFSFIAKDNFSWKENSSNTNPNIEEHNNFLEQCKGAISTSINIPSAKSFHISFTGNGSVTLKNQIDKCRKNFKLAASGSPVNRNAASQDPFATSVQDTTSPTNNGSGSNGASSSQQSSTKATPAKPHDPAKETAPPK